MRDAPLHPLLHPRTIPIDELHLTIMCCIRYGAEDQRGRLVSSSPSSHLSSSHVSSAHRVIVSSSHRRIFSLPSHCRIFALPSHRRIIPSSHRRILHAVPSSHRLIFTSSHRRTPSTMPHRLIVPSSHLLIIPSSNTINNASSSHRLIDSPSHRLSFASSHRRTPSRMFHRLVVWSSGRVLCCVCVRAEGARVCVRARAALRNWQWRMRRICVVMGGGSGACGGRRLGLVARCGDRALEQINAFVYLLGIISPVGDVISSPAQGRSSGTT